jgi:hypothetical protein
MILCSPLALSCPPNSLDCITWGNAKSMTDHSARQLTIRCQDYASFYLTGKPWGAITVNYLDGATGKDSFALYVDGKLMGAVDDADEGVGIFTSRMVSIWQRTEGKHLVELRSTEDKTCEDAKITINWISLGKDRVTMGGGGGARRLAVAVLPDEWLPDEWQEPEVPEFGTIAMVVAAVGGLAGFFILRKR